MWPFNKLFAKGYEKEIEVKIDKTTPEEKRNIDLVITRHMNKIRSLDNHISKLAKEIVETEEDLILNKGVKEKKSDKIVNRISMIRHEITVREELIKWLTY